MGLLDALKKKKATKMPVKELETPPAPEGASAFPSSIEPAPALEIKSAAPEFLLPQASSSMPFESREEPEAFPQQIAMPEQRMPPMAAPRAEIPPAMQAAMEQPMPFGRELEEIPMPMPEMRGMSPMQMPPLQQQSQFRFFEAAAEEPSAAPAFSEMQPESDVSQELLSIPAEYQEQHPELYKEEEEEKPYAVVPGAKKPGALQALKKGALQPVHHYPKPYMTVASLFEVGEQLINLREDLSLGRDTVFRLIDLNEQEIALIAKWQVLQNSMELRVAEIDKVLFKA